MNCSGGVCHLVKDKKGSDEEKQSGKNDTATTIHSSSSYIDEMKKQEQQWKLLKEFQVQLLSFIDELIEQFPRVSEFVICRIFIKDQIPATDLLGRFIRDLLPLKEQVDQRDETFFLENSLLYTKGQVSSERVDKFKELWLSSQLDAEDRLVIWKWMDVFMQVAQKYHKNFGPVEGW